MKKAVTTAEAILKFENNEVSLPVISGTEGEKAVDISGLRKATGLITMDPGFANTANCCSHRCCNRSCSCFGCGLRHIFAEFLSYG